MDMNGVLGHLSPFYRPVIRSIPLLIHTVGMSGTDCLTPSNRHPDFTSVSDGGKYGFRAIAAFLALPAYTTIPLHLTGHWKGPKRTF